MKPVGPEQIQDTHEHDYIALCVSNLKKYERMKKLGRLKLNPEKLLSHDELVSFKGGSGSSCPDGTRKWSYLCHGTPGAWEGCYASSGEATKAALYWCANGTGASCYPLGYL